MTEERRPSHSSIETIDNGDQQGSSPIDPTLVDGVFDIRVPKPTPDELVERQDETTTKTERASESSQSQIHKHSTQQQFHGLVQQQRMESKPMSWPPQMLPRPILPSQFSQSNPTVSDRIDSYQQNSSQGQNLRSQVPDDGVGVCNVAGLSAPDAVRLPQHAQPGFSMLQAVVGSPMTPGVGRSFVCQARGVPSEHNESNANIYVPPFADHGMTLRCSNAACRASGRRFRWCVVCQVPVAKGNFVKRHSHDEQLRSIRNQRKTTAG